MIAARNSNTDTSGPTVTKRSWRAGDWLRHQWPKSRRRTAGAGRAGEGEGEADISRIIKPPEEGIAAPGHAAAQHNFVL
jgi:hypothetical protein